jgi:hypothetical protein
MSNCTLSDITFVPPFVFALVVGRGTDFLIETDPPGRTVTWTIPAGVKQDALVANGHRLSVVWLTPGVKKLTATCGKDKKSIEVPIAPASTPPPPRPYGEPEPVPEIVYVSTKGQSGFLDAATAFHRQWGLPVKSVDSLEAVVDDLQRSRQTLGRIRVVTHAFAIELGPSAPATLIMNLFEKSPVGFTENVLRGFAKSDEAGLSELEKIKDPGTRAQAIRAANSAIKRGFRDKLNRMRNRFTKDSWIDIRGCEVGASAGYLKAIAEFFGSGTNRPRVSAPDLFQSFLVPNREAVPPQKFEASGEQLAKEADVVTQFDHWFKIWRLDFGKVPATKKIADFLDSGFVAPVSRDPQCNPIRLPTLYMGSDPSTGAPNAFAKDSWLKAMWTPTLTSAAEKLAKPWKKNSEAPRVAALCGTVDKNGKVDPLGETKILVSPDPDYKKHIRTT